MIKHNSKVNFLKRDGNKIWFETHIEGKIYHGCMEIDLTTSHLQSKSRKNQLRTKKYQKRLTNYLTKKHRQIIEAKLAENLSKHNNGKLQQNINLDFLNEKHMLRTLSALHYVKSSNITLHLTESDPGQVLPPLQF